MEKKQPKKEANKKESKKRADKYNTKLAVKGGFLSLVKLALTPDKKK